MDYRKAIKKYMYLTNDAKEGIPELHGLYKLICSFPTDIQPQAFYYIHSPNESFSEDDLSSDWPMPDMNCNISFDENDTALLNATEQFTGYIDRIVNDAIVNKVPRPEIYRMIWREIRTNKFLSSELARTMAFICLLTSDPARSSEDTTNPHEHKNQVDPDQRFIKDVADLDYEVLSEIKNLLNSTSLNLDQVTDRCLDIILAGKTRQEQKLRLFAVMSFSTPDNK